MCRNWHVLVDTMTNSPSLRFRLGNWEVILADREIATPILMYTCIILVFALPIALGVWSIMH